MSKQTELREDFELSSREDERVAINYTAVDRLVRDYVTRGLVVLHPDSLGVPLNVHDEIFDLELKALREKQRITAENVPDIMKITSAPGVVQACEALVGPNFAIVPFTHNTPFMSGSNDQHWHKDDNGPYNLRKQRHHQAIQLEMLYYPQEVKADMGPTATVPYSQYWTFNHEENHDNFAGADHLDFAYQISGMERIPVSGPRSGYELDDIVNRTTDHDVRMRQAVINLGWPNCQPFEVGPLEAGSVVLYSHNLLHRGNHRRDDWRTWKDNPRFMWRFWLFRTTEPKKRVWNGIDWRDSKYDDMTKQTVALWDENVTSVWCYHHRWMESGEKSVVATNEEPDPDSVPVETLGNQLFLIGDEEEPSRIGAAYRLAEHEERSRATSLLGQALNSDRESVRRAGLYGLIALGKPASRVLLGAIKSDARWVRKAAAFGLGSAGKLSTRVVDALGSRLLLDPSVYVRSVAADALGCFGRRAVVKSNSRHLVEACASFLIDSLTLETNRLSMDRAQGRNIKMVRPTDECDVCEGIGFDYGQDRYEPVRSVVRENALWAMVILCSHGADKLGSALDEVIESMTQVISEDKNVFCVGFAMDVLSRLVHLTPRSTTIDAIDELRSELDSIFALTPIYSLEALVASGTPLNEAVAKYAHRPLL